MAPKKSKQGETSSSGSQSQSHSRKSSNASTKQPHTPAIPSQLREVYAPSDRSSSPEETMHNRSNRENEPRPSSSPSQPGLDVTNDGIRPAPDHTSVHSNDENAPPQLRGTLDLDLESTVRTRLLNHKNWDAASGCGSENCEHGTLSPRPYSPKDYGSINSDAGFGGRYPGSLDAHTGEPSDVTHALLGDAVADGVLGGGGGQKMSTTRYLAERHGVRHRRMM